MTATKIYRAADVGYGWTKYTTRSLRNDGDGRLVADAQSFQSAPFPRVGSFDMGGVGPQPKIISVNVAGIEYCVSDEPAKIAPASSSRGKGESYVESIAYEVCLAAAIKAMNVNEIDSLVLGTPVGNFQTAKASLVKKFSDGIRFDGRSVPIHKLRVLVQPIGGLIWHYFSNSRVGEIKEAPRLLVDVGYGTLDWVVTEGLTPNPAKSGSTHDGVSAFVDAICLMLRNGESRIGKDSLMIDRVDKLLTRHAAFTRDGREWTYPEIAPHVTTLAQTATQNILESIGDPAMLESVVLMGGGARLYQGTLSKALHPLKIELIGNAQYANVNGFQIIAEPR
jgi:plasmid segregation protein ParM